MNKLEEGLSNGLKLFTNENLWINIGRGALRIVIILIVSTILIRLGKLAIKNIFKIRTHSAIRITERREATLAKLLENTIRYVVYFISAMAILSVFDINVQGLLAGAGIVGLAVGFGAQSLVKDVITGFFIIFEDQFSVGDYVRIGTFEGTVEEIGLRTTKIKSYTGEVNILPNGSIVEVTNFSVNNSKAVVDISIAYQGDINRAESVIQEHIKTLEGKYEQIVGAPEFLGIQSIQGSEIVLRIVAETLPTQQVAVSRILRKEIKNVLDENGIESPYPKLVMYSKPDNSN
ncbi:MAG: mechanosensitive ion channel family protein [Bacillus sp. (in: firmicutes)]